MLQVLAGGMQGLVKLLTGAWRRNRDGIKLDSCGLTRRKRCLSLMALPRSPSLFFICSINLLCFFPCISYSGTLPNDFSAGVVYSNDDTTKNLSRILFNGAYTGDNPGALSGGFLWTYSINGLTWHHKGLDFRARNSFDVYSPLAGVVLAGGANSNSEVVDGTLSDAAAINFINKYGVVVIYDSLHDLSFNFQHLSRKDVVVGQIIEVGDRIGASGDVGAEGSPHLHVGLRSGKTVRDGALNTTTDSSNYDPRLVSTYFNSLKFSPASYSELIKNSGLINVSVLGWNQYPGKVILYNGPSVVFSQPYIAYEADINIAPNNWVDNFVSTSVAVNLFSPSSLGNTATTFGSPAIDNKFIYPVKIQVFGGIDPITGLSPMLGQSYYPFRDVKPDHWASCFIMKLWRNGIVNGQDGLFRPSDSVSRAEFLKMTMNAAFSPSLFTSTTPVTYFKDTDFVSWQFPYVNAALQSNIVHGSWCLGSSTDYCFYPNAPISRSEAVTILVRSFGLQQNGAAINFSDAPASQYPLVSVAASNKGNSGCGGVDVPIISGFSNGKFDPNAQITRDQAAKIVAVALSLKKP